MAAVFAILISVNLVFSNIRVTSASTHWVVTEDGRIQSQMDSMFNMKRPYDLVAFMKQEERAYMLDKLKQELLSRKDEIDQTEDRDMGLEEKFYKSDADCLAAGKQLPELDLYISTVLPLENKGIRPDDHLPPFVPGSFLMQPECTMYTELLYSPYAFEHLEGMKDRRKLTGTPELGLRNAITYQNDVDEYGHRIFEAFKQNKTSWVLYNMAAFYWRIKGEPYNVIECVRRALHYSPRHQKDVALISLANVLHRGLKSNEAAIVVHAALDISKELNVNHFTLGNIYAVLGEYNKSVICFENTLRIQPDFEAAAKRKHAVLCHANLENALEAQHRSLQRTLNDLKDYQHKHDFWQQHNDKLLSEQVPVDIKKAQQQAYEDLKLKEMSSNIGEYCKMTDRDGKQVLMCSWGKKNEPSLGIDFMPMSDKNGMEKDEKSNESSPGSNDNINTDYAKPFQGQKYTFETVKVPRYQGSTPDYLREAWPSKEECDLNVQKVPDARNLTSTYLPPEHKGYEVKSLLTSGIGLKEGAEHVLPWYPPVCVTLLDIPEGNTKSHDDLHSLSLEQRKTIPPRLEDKYHTQALLNLVNSGNVTIEEIGQRILTAIKQSSGPRWILFNLAGLYWRIIGNNYHAIECFRRAIYTSPDDVADVPEINLANVLYMWGKYDDAKELIRLAMKLNQYEPASNVLLGHIEWVQKNYTGAIWRYQQALEAEPNDLDIVKTLRDLKCYMKFHQAVQSKAPLKEATDGKCVAEACLSKSGECEGKCTIAPLLDTCNGHSPLTVEGPEGKMHGFCGQFNMCCNRCSRCENGEDNTNADVAINLNEDEMQAHAIEIAEQLEKAAFCEGEGCRNIENFKHNGQPPHIKLEFINGQLFQKRVFAQSVNEITVRPEECVLFNDGSKSDGCSRPEFKAYQVDKDTVSIIITNGYEARISPVLTESGTLPFLMKLDIIQDTVSSQGQVDERALSDDDDDSKMQGLNADEALIEDNKGKVQLPSDNGAKTVDEYRQGPGLIRDGVLTEENGDEIYVKPPPFQAYSVVDGPQQEAASNEQQKGKDILEISDSLLPDVLKHIQVRYILTPPKPEQCKLMKHLDTQKFSSTWLSLQAKHIHVPDFIDFHEPIMTGDYMEPVCSYTVPVTTVFNHLPGFQYRKELDYQPESGLKMVLQRLGGQEETVEVMGTRLAKALQKNETSWVLANIAGLYWRVQGDATKALECLNLALFTSPRDTKDVALLSVSSILHHAGYINDAIICTNYALDFSPQLVLAHFSMANLFAAKDKWDYAAMFYESTLGLQTNFEPAKERLRAIQCQRLMQQHKVKDNHVTTR